MIIYSAKRQLFTTTNVFLALLNDIYSAKMIFVIVKRNILTPWSF